jgi:superfamily II DNA/RNA helicase
MKNLLELQMLKPSIIQAAAIPRIMNQAEAGTKD